MTALRLVPVLLDFSVLTGEQHPRPRVGDIAAFGLGFIEATEHTDPDDPTLCTVTSRLERLRDGQPWRRRRRNGEEYGWARWSNLLHGDGWSASWTSFRPPPDTDGERGEVELRGHLCSDFSALTSGRVRGVVRHLWTVHSRRDVAADPERMETWPPAWGSTRLTAIHEMPMAAHGQPWPALLPGLTYTGLLAELEPTAEPENDGGVGR